MPTARIKELETETRLSRLQSAPWQTGSVRYGLAIALTILAALLKEWILPETHIAPFLFFFGSISISAWHGGLGPGLLATFLAALISNYFFILPTGTLSLAWHHVVLVALFLLEGIFLSLLSHAKREAEATARHRGQQNLDSLQREKQAREEAERARIEAEAANQAKDVFLATVSHELRTPLNSILGWCQLLEDGQLDEASARKAVATVQRSARGQAKLVNDLLDISRIISGQLSLDMEPIELYPVIQAALDVLRPLAMEKNIRFERQIHARPQVTGDAQRLQQVVSNLVQNAIKFSPENSIIEIRLEEDREKGVARISVQDQGVGIAPEFLPDLFKRFSQADSTDTRRHSGLGLGLSIAQHLVHGHGGVITAHSEGENKGALMTVELPLLAESV